MKMSRKEFLRSIIGVGVGAAGISALAACGGGDSDDEPPVVDGPSNRSCQQNGTSINVSNTDGHVHTMTVPKADVVAGTEKTYMMSNNSGHIHMFTVTAPMFGMLQNNQAVMGASTNDSGHVHTVTITCI